MILSIIIPIYNEKNTILELLKRIGDVNLQDLGFEKEIIIIDDCSTDGTKEILKKIENKYKIIYHSQNQGKGMAIRNGLNKVTGDYIIIQDADLEYDPKDYKKILDCALKNNSAVVYGFRKIYSNGKNLSLSYFLGGIFLTLLTNFLYGVKIKDESTCYKLFKTEIIKSIPLNCKKFEFCSEITAKIAKRKIKIYEVPINYFRRNKKEGKKIKWRDGFYAIWILIKYKFSN